MRLIKRKTNINFLGQTRRKIALAISVLVVVVSLFELAGRERLDPERVHILLQESAMRENKPGAGNVEAETDEAGEVSIQTRHKLIRPRGPNQTAYMKSIRDKDLAFGIGPAGTGKSTGIRYLARSLGITVTAAEACLEDTSADLRYSSARGIPL